VVETKEFPESEIPVPGGPLLVFDVNETLLDLDTLAPTFERIFGDRSVLRLWFADLVLYSEALTLAGAYVPFTEIGSAVLKMLATTQGIAWPHASSALCHAPDRSSRTLTSGVSNL
jgi:2-haloacid dehalogenase